MAKVRKRGKAYQIDYFDPNGKRIRKSFRKKKEAEAELGKRVSLIAEGRYLDVKKEYKNTLNELIDKYTENYKHQSGYQTGKKFYITNFRKHFGVNTLLASIKYLDLETYRNHLRQKPVKNGKYGPVRTDASVNREMSCLHHIFSKAVEWEMVEQNPFDRGKSLKLKENNKRMRFLTDTEIRKLLDECPKHLRDIVECALNTGMRRGEIFNLRWSQIRNGFIYLDKTKTNDARQVPINNDLQALFNRLKKNRKLPKVYAFPYSGKTEKREQNFSSQPVFTYKGRQMKDVRNGFNSAVERAGIQDFTFHDLRHTFASQVLLKGGTLKDIQELLGHKTMTMTLRYAHLTQEHKRKAVNLLNGLTTKHLKCHKTVTKTHLEEVAIL
ncbi:tyrosine-type recombinase/integrase [Thermodesulfobacteriota bacterium]